MRMGVSRPNQVLASALILGMLVVVGPLVLRAGPFTTGPLVPVSAVNPIAACTADDVAGQIARDPTGQRRVFRNSEVEPWVDVNPMDPNNIVAFYQQDRWSDGGSRALVAGVSKDGGASWTPVAIPGISLCSGGTFQRATDPWLSFAPNGVLHQLSLALDIDPPSNRPGGNGRNALLVSRSANGGINWTAPITIIEDENPRFLNDKQSITADPTDSNLVYAVWDRLKSSTGNIINPERVPGDLSFKGAAMFSRTTDGGVTWEPARVLYDPGAISQTIGNQIVVMPDGTLVAFFDEILGASNRAGAGPFNLSLKRSFDKGVTFLPNGPPIRTNKLLPQGVVTPDLHRAVRDGALLFDVAVDADSGNLYAVWQDSRFSGFRFDEVAFSMSTDGGLTWTAPTKVNRTPATPANPLRQQAFLPSVAVLGDGTVVVTYYDFRNDNNTGELADYFAVHCHAPCSGGASFEEEVELTDASFDILNAPVARGLFLGDYMGLAARGQNAFAVFAQPHLTAGGTVDRSSVFFRRTRP
jgi:hypothetical protein